MHVMLRLKNIAYRVFDNQTVVHALRHTYATELANTNISVYSLMKLLGHESLATSQRYVISAGSETKAAAAQNPLYGLIEPAARSGKAK